jgi:hypothetical protein
MPDSTLRRSSTRARSLEHWLGVPHQWHTGHSTVGTGNVTVTKSINTSATQEWTLTFKNSLGGQNVAQVTVNSGSVMYTGTKTNIGGRIELPFRLVLILGSAVLIGSCNKNDSAPLHAVKNSGSSETLPSDSNSFSRMLARMPRNNGDRCVGISVVLESLLERESIGHDVP